MTEQRPASAAEAAAAKTAPKKAAAPPKPPKVGDEVIVRQVNGLRQIIETPGKILELDGKTTLAKIKLLEGKARGMAVHALRYAERAKERNGPTDLCCPSWVVDRTEVA